MSEGGHRGKGEADELVVCTCCGLSKNRCWLARGSPLVNRRSSVGRCRASQASFGSVNVVWPSHKSPRNQPTPQSHCTFCLPPPARSSPHFHVVAASPSLLSHARSPLSYLKSFSFSFLSIWLTCRDRTQRPRGCYRPIPRNAAPLISRHFSGGTPPDSICFAGTRASPHTSEKVSSSFPMGLHTADGTTDAHRLGSVARCILPPPPPRRHYHDHRGVCPRAITSPRRSTSYKCHVTVASSQPTATRCAYQEWPPYDTDQDPMRPLARHYEVRPV